MQKESVGLNVGCVFLAGLAVVLGAVAARAEVPEGEASYEGEPLFQGHPADVNENWRLVMDEAIGYLAGWQGGGNPMSYAIRAVYLWQKGEWYTYDTGEDPPMC